MICVSFLREIRGIKKHKNGFVIPGSGVQIQINTVRAHWGNHCFLHLLYIAVQRRLPARAY